MGMKRGEKEVDGSPPMRFWLFLSLLFPGKTCKSQVGVREISVVHDDMCLFGGAADKEEHKAFRAVDTIIPSTL